MAFPVSNGMENPFDKKPWALVISLGAIVVLILGAGVLSTYYNRLQSPVGAITLPDSPYSVSWDDGVQTLTAAGPISRPANVKLSLLDVHASSISLGVETMTAPALAFNLGALISISSSTGKICDWKFPIYLRRVTDENGTLAPPQDSYFTPTENNTCIDPAKPIFLEKEIIFPVSASDNNLLFTTGGSSNIFFTIHVSPTGTIDVERAPQEIPG